MTQEYRKLSYIFKDMIKNGDVKGPLTIPDGRDSDSITVETSLPGQTNQKERYWPFVIPDGYIRFSGKFDKEHNSGDEAHCDLANANPVDGTVYGFVKCSQVNGYAKAAVSNVHAIKPEAAKRLYELSKEE